MEPRILESPGSPVSQPPENLLNATRHYFISLENYPQNPLIANLHSSSNQSIESAFSRLTLSPSSRFRPQTPSLLGCLATRNAAAPAEPVPLPMAFPENQPSLFWAEASSSNGGVNEPFGFPGAPQDINIGSEVMGFSGRSPYLHGDGHNRLMNFHQQDFLDASFDEYENSILHGTETISRNVVYNLPELPFDEQSNFGSSAPSLYNSNQQMYKWQQQLLSIENIRGRILSMVKDQKWNGILNQKLDAGLSQDEVEILLPEVMEFSSDLMQHQSGSQFVQKFFVWFNEGQKTRFIMDLTRYPFKFITLCMNSNGARAIQKMLEKMHMPQQMSLVVTTVAAGAYALATDPNGQHIIHYCVRHYPSHYSKLLLDVIADNCLNIATDKSGCCVLQSCVDHSRGEARQRLISEITANAVHLAEDPYGNYVVQHLLGLQIPEVSVDLLRRFKGHFMSLSCNKYASNVVEKFLIHSRENHSAAVVMELLQSPNAPMLLLDPFGNFVIQSALSASKGHIYDALLKLIRVNAPSMQSNLYGRKILAKVRREET